LLACFIYHVLWQCASCTACKHAVMLQTIQPHQQFVWDVSKWDWMTTHDIICCDQAEPHCNACIGTAEELPLQGAKLQQSFVSRPFLLLAGSVVAVTSSAHHPPNLQFTTQAASNSPGWVPLALEGSWPFDKVVEQALPKMHHQVLQVHIFVSCYSGNTLCSSCSAFQLLVVPRQFHK